MKKYHHLTLVEREELYALKKAGLSLGAIAKKLKRDKGTVSRELKRNNIRVGRAPTNKYVPCKAQEKARKRAVKQRREAAWKGPEVLLYIREHLKEPYCWTPEQIAGRLTLEHKELSICHETIYQSIYKPQNKKYKLWQYLPSKRKKRMKKGGRRVGKDSRIPEAVSIDLRPQEVNERQTIGHWESDNVVGKQTDKTALSVTVERKIKLTIISKVLKTAESKNQALFKRLSILPEELLQTLTEDNGAENTKHQQITESLRLAVYFCHAYHSWERGTNENTNGRIRRDIPKGISIDPISEKTIAQVEWKLNNTPRKCLGFKTPLEMLEEILQNTPTSNRCTSA